MPLLIITTSAAVLISFPSSCFDVTLYIDRMDVISSIFRKRETPTQILTQYYQSTCSKFTFAKARHTDKAQLGGKRRSMCHSFQKRSSWVSEYVHPGRRVPKVQFWVTQKCCLCLYKRQKCVGNASGKRSALNSYSLMKALQVVVASYQRFNLPHLRCDSITRSRLL